MKTIIPLTVSLTILALLLLLLQGQAPSNSNDSPSSASGSISKAAESVLTSTGTLKDSIPGIRTKTGPRSVKVSEWAVRKAADDEIARLKDPLKSLFQRWGLREGALSDALDLIHDKHVQTGLALNQRVDEMADTPTHETDKLYQQRQSAIATRYEAEMLIIVGSTQRLFEMTTLVTRVNYDDYKAGAPARKTQADKIQQLIATDVAKLKASHGSNYKQVMRERYGDAATESMLQLLEEARD